jgi:hypothetical protein
MASADRRVEGRLHQLEAIFRSERYVFSEQDRGHLREYLRNNDGRSRYPHLIDPDASKLAHSAAAFDWESRRPPDDRQAPTTLDAAHRRLYRQFGGLSAGPRTGGAISAQAVVAGESLRNLSEPQSFAKAAGEYYAAVTAARPYGRGSGIAAQLHIDRQAQLAGHSVDWQRFHEVRNSPAGRVVTATTGAEQASRAERAFSAAIYLRTFRTPQAQRSRARQTTQKARTAGSGRRSGALGRLKRGLGLGRRQERQTRNARRGQRAR